MAQRTGGVAPPAALNARRKSPLAGFSGTVPMVGHRPEKDMVSFCSLLLAASYCHVASLVTTEHVRKISEITPLAWSAFRT